MKRKFLFALVATVLSIAMCLLVACTPGDPNKGPNDDDKGDYVAMTWDDFEVASQTFADPVKYSNLQGLKLDVALTMAPTATEGATPAAATESKEFKYNIGAIVVLSDAESLSASVNLTTEGVDEGMSALNAYLYSGKLYVDMTTDGKTEKDSIDGLDFGLADIMGLVGGSGTSSVPGMGSMIPGLGTDMPSQEAIAAYLDFFKGKTTITYSAKKGNYVLKAALDEKETVNETEIPAFELTLSLTVKNDRVTSLEADFGMKDGSLTLDASLAEYNGKINTPTDPESYNGTMLDEIEQMIKAMLVKESDFYGTWTGLAEDGSSVSLTVSEQGASLTVALNVSGQLQEPTTVEMDSVEFANMTLTMKDGENVYTAMIVDNSLVVIMPSMSSALLTKVTE